jgi:hypothetical protein
VTEHHGRISALLVHDNVLYSASDDRTVLVWQEVSIPLCIGCFVDEPLFVPSLSLCSLLYPCLTQSMQQRTFVTPARRALPSRYRHLSILASIFSSLFFFCSRWCYW